MPNLRHLIPDASTVKSMHPGDLAGYMLEVLFSMNERSLWNRRNFCMAMADQYKRAPGEGGDAEVARACAVAWSWLEGHWLICKDPEQDHDWYISTPAGVELRDRAGVRKLMEASELPPHFLHRSLLRDVLPFFLQGRFDTAVFEAFHRLEIAIRDAAGLGDDLIGTKLAARAFNPVDGPLTDSEAEAGECQALMSLMAGAIGSYKNPQSHRHVGLDAPEAREMIMMASHLLGIVDSRCAKRATKTSTPSLPT